MTSGDIRGKGPQDRDPQKRDQQERDPQDRDPGNEASENEVPQNEVSQNEMPQDKAPRNDDATTAEPAPATADPGASDESGTAAPPSPPSRESEEEVLRRLLHDTVQGLEPSSGSLEHLRRAVPARRSHRRQAFVGAAASLLLAVAAVPAVIHTTTASDSSSNAAHESQARPVEQGEKGDRAAKPTPDPGKKRSDERTEEKQTGGPEPGGTGGPPERSSPSTPERPHNTETMTVETPACTAEQLGPGTVDLGAPDGEGKVYGAFHLVNVSAENCVVDGAGMLQASAQGAADPGRVASAPYTAGGPASGLPDVAAQKIVLAPGQSFEVRFGWVPESGTNGCETASGSTSGEEAPGDGTESGGGSGEPPAADPPTGSVAVTYTPGSGGPSQTGNVNGVCAGTVYYTPPALAA